MVVSPTDVVGSQWSSSIGCEVRHGPVSNLLTGPFDVCSSRGGIRSL